MRRAKQECKQLMRRLEVPSAQNITPTGSSVSKHNCLNRKIPDSYLAENSPWLSHFPGIPVK